MTSLHAERALLPAGFARNVDIRLGPDGRIVSVRADVPAGPGSQRVGTVLPGIPNLHSHAFQRGLAGRTEHAGPGRDSFWTWRQRMYELAGRITAADLTAIATWLYGEMLAAGYTTVCEFHYLHRGVGPGDDPAAMARALIRAADAAGIRLTLLPTLYLYSGFGSRPPEPAQERFVCSIEEYLALTDALRRESGPTVRIGYACHSLRAVDPAALARVLAHRARVAPDSPMHLHVAEQLQEVDECEAWSGRRPVEWLLDHGLPDRHWCLVHATQMTASETRALAATGATVALCPSTEANLGDGLFPLADFLAAGGRIGIGSDSHVTVDPWEELRWLDYGQRLTSGQRNVAASETEPRTGLRLLRAVLATGPDATGHPTGRIEAGAAADLVEVETGSPLLAGCGDEELADFLVFAERGARVRGTLVAGRWAYRATDGIRPEVAKACGAALARLRTGVSA